MNAPPAAIPRLILGAVFLAYFVGTALLYFWGPWTYPMTGGTGPLITFLVAVHVAFAAGYFTGTRGRPRRSRVEIPVERLVLASVLVQLALLLPTAHFNTGQWIPNPFAAASNFGGVYTESLARRQSGTPYVNYIRILMAPLIALAVPFGVFYWRRLPRLTKGLFVVSVVGTLLIYMAMGTNVAAGDWMALLPWFILAGHLSRAQPLDRRGWATAAGVQVLSMTLFAGLFSAAMVQRSGSFAKWGSITSIGAKLDSRAPAAVAVPKPMAPPAQQPVSPTRSATRIGADGLAGYVTQGYYGVYLSLQEPFVPCYGVGHSAFLHRQVVRLTGNPRFLECTYPMRIEKRGWRASAYWATIYPWIASDATFPGTIVVVFLIAWLSGRVWLDILGGGNPVAVALLGQLLLMLYFFPAHNRVMQMGESVVALSVFLVAWLWTRQRHPVAR